MFVFWIPLALSFLVCGLLTTTKALHFTSLNPGCDTSAIQASHTRPTPRIGGVGVMSGLVVGATCAYLNGQILLSQILITALPMFVIGLVEDVCRNTSTLIRYCVTAISTLIAVWVLGVWITAADAYVLDWVLSYWPIAVVVTMFVVASFCHAFNLIDGLNGLASGTAILVAMGLAAIATKSELPEVVSICLIIAASVGGFMVYNFPMGRIFLGDAGAYLVGYTLTWMALVILHMRPEAAGWAMFLVFFWPLADTLFAVYRRRKQGVSLVAADRLHYHQLVLRGLEIFFLGRGNRRLANPLATTLMLPFIAAPVLAGVFLWDKPVPAFCALVGFGAIFIFTYRIGMRAVHVRRRRPILHGLNRVSPAE